MSDCEKAEQFVCISCIEEVRYSFVSHLSEALSRKGINDVVVDVDSDDLLSEESQAKVERARVSVMVLPGNCEPTTVCLDKFVKVLQYQRNNNPVVIPVLYGDSPLHDGWLSALDSRQLSPLHQSRKECSDSRFVEEIVRDVYHKLFHMGRIGIYSKLLEIENMVCKQPFGIRHLGIWGMPGIGKTTLAKAVFDQMSGYFNAYCFIEDYEKAVGEKGLYRLLEEQLLKEHLSTGDTIAKLSLLRDKLSSKRVLVVLDDVRNPLAAESFLEGFDWFGPESLIVITSRDKQVFSLCRINQIFEVQGLNENESLQLLMQCASIKDTEEKNLHQQLMEIIKYASGNPLALSIYGGELKGKKTPQEMETGFLRLREHPPVKFFDSIKRSYDTLNDSDKNIFLDIACFFQGENVDYMMQLLEGCGFFPHVGVDVLVEKCLVTISENRVRMHNLIQDVVRERIIKEETIPIERRSRLWEPRSIKYLLEDNEHTENGEPKTTVKCAQGTEEIEGIFLDTSNLSFDINPAAFKNMLNLRLLKIFCSDSEIHPVISFSKGFLHFFPNELKVFLLSLPNELRLLHWENYPLPSLPQIFDPRHLVEINMTYSQLQKLWGGTKSLEMLKTFRLCHSRQLVDLDDILKAPNIEVVDLQGCTRLQSFPATGKLLHLRDVNLSGCTKINSFPEIPPNTETLHLQGTGITELPISIVKPNYREFMNLLTDIPGLVSNLKQNDLEPLTSVMKMISSSQDLGKLICLDLKDCSRLRSLPNLICSEFLQVLDLSGCSELESIQGFPRNLKELHIAGTAVREVPTLPQSLELLNAHGCVSLTSICLNCEHFPMHYTFSNCFNLSPQLFNDFLVKVLDNVKHIPREHPQELREALAFSFCAPSRVNQNSTLDLQPGSSVTTRLNPSWKSSLVGFAMLVEVAFSADYYDAAGFYISCVCRWQNKEDDSHRIERNLHCWAKAAPNVQKDHVFVFCDTKMRPGTGERIDPNILDDSVVFEFVPVNKQMKRLDDTCTVTRCGVYVITAPTDNTSLEHLSPVLSLDQMNSSGNEAEEVLRVKYDPTSKSSLEHISPVLSLDQMKFSGNEAEEVPNVSYDPTSNPSLEHVSPVLSLDQMEFSGNEDEEVLRVSYDPTSNLSLEHISPVLSPMLPGSTKDLTRDFEKVSSASTMFTRASSSSSHKWRYDVYPSFRGEDVRENFIGNLLSALRRRSSVTFVDSDIVKGRLIGPLLVQAIRESRISIVVFSKNYASSSWLLNELVEIAKCKQELDQKVILIFYDVDPSNVRKQTGEFGRHFKQTCKGKTADETQQWQQALSSIANLAGEDSWCWDNEASMVEKIATDVSNLLKNSTPSNDFDDYVGMKAHIAKINPLLSLESEEVKMIGIWGPVGIGKSTIAKKLYNEISPEFQLSAFLNIPNISDKRGEYMDDYSVMLYLQQLVLSEIINQKDLRINHLGAMQDRLKDKKVLLILDGVDDLLALEALARNFGWFGRGSRIIVTTKDLRLLMAHGICHIYKVDLPSKKQALQMFCQTAFKQNDPPDDFMSLADEVVKLSGNLPLVLKVYGSYFRGLDKADWLKSLPRFRNILGGEIGSILRLGYDELGDKEKDLFLLIACLFNDVTVEYLSGLLIDTDTVRLGLRILAEKALIHISEHGNVTMHHLQQQLGREIVQKQSIAEPGRRKFLVDCLDICDVFKENTGTRSVVGISWDMSQIKELIMIGREGFSEMSNLQFLKFYTIFGDKEVKVRLPHELYYLSPKLRLLHWEGFPMRCMPSNFIPKHLVELTMVASKLEELWSGIQPLESLKRMNLQGSLHLTEIPDLTYATNLETLDLGGCSSLTKLPSSIGHLHKLKDLDMQRCAYLGDLPTGINLESLHYLNLNECSRLRSFPDISTSISDLYLDGTAIEEVPWWIEKITGLSYLSMNGCQHLQKISPNISKLKHLVEVDFSECKALSEDSWQNHPEEICTSLMRVNMSHNSFERLPDTWTSIQPKDLDLGNCRNLVSLPELPASLFNLTANYCDSLESVYGSFDQPEMALQFINCLKLNRQAREFILHSDCACAILPGEELPAYFTHRVDGNFLTVSLPWIALSKKILRFKACIVVKPRVCRFDFGINWLFRGGSDTKYFSCKTSIHSKTNHLIIFGFEFSIDGFSDPPADLNYSDVQFKFFCFDHTNKIIQIKEGGIELLEKSPYLDDSWESSEKSGENDAEARRSRKKMRIT